MRLVTLNEIGSFGSPAIAFRETAKGPLCEHRVLNELHSLTQGKNDIRYWRDKQGHEVDFIWVRRGKPPVAIECKWSARHAEFDNLRLFRKHYADGENWIVASDVKTPYKQNFEGLHVLFLGLDHLTERTKDYNVKRRGRR